MIKYNEFKHRKNLIMSRENAFRITQEQVNKNLTQTLLPLFGTSWGVIADLNSGGVMTSPNLSVERYSDSQIMVSAGTALSMSKELIYNAETMIKSTVGETGIKYVNIDPQTLKVSSGKENYLPGKELLRQNQL